MKTTDRINPVTLRMSLYKVYNKATIIDRISKDDTPFLDSSETDRTFDQIKDAIYWPILSFVSIYNLQLNLIVSGEFLDKLAKRDPELLKLMKKLVANKNLLLVADAYYGDSLSCLYNSSLWAQRIEKTYQTLDKYFGVKPIRIFLSQLYRNLELEKLLSFEPSPKFLLRNRGKRVKKEVIMLSELRRFDGKALPWINSENDCKLDFFYVPDDMFNEVNSLVFEQKLSTVVQAFSMEIGVKYSRFVLRKTKRATKQMKEKTRINEKYSVYLYNQLQRSILRLWEYAAFLITSELNNQTGESLKLVKSVAKQFAGFQDPFYLDFLDTSLYLSPKKTITRFSSPYEAYLNMQACVKNIEILLKNRV